MNAAPPPGPVSSFGQRVEANLRALRLQSAIAPALPVSAPIVVPPPATPPAPPPRVGALATYRALRATDPNQARAYGLANRAAILAESEAGQALPAVSPAAAANEPFYREWQRLKAAGLRDEAGAYRRQNEAQIRAYAATQPDTL